ncbi:hypothetical protein F2Q68_00038714 [Brassica cretica]|uniref:Uncharacterized protein n=1 Tax=Brassica cretica TaxID=69181 RepID=A0A8S9MTJ7_BRACR|nr:hypothetical protein F2Q68_00038714 [Brassica cretica]
MTVYACRQPPAAIGRVEIQVSIDSVHPTSIDSVHPTSIDTVHLTSIDTVHLTLIDTVHPTWIDTVHQPSIDTSHQPSIDTVHPPSTDIVHPPSTETVHLPFDTTCLEAEKVEVLILKVDENGMLRDEEGRTRNNEEYMIPIQLLDDIMAKRDEQHGFGEPSRAAEAETTDLTSTSIDTTPGTSIDTNTSMLIDSSTSESIDIGTSETIDTIEVLILKVDENGMLRDEEDEEYMIPIQLLDDIMAKRDEQHGFGEPSRAAEAETTDLTSTSIDTTPGTSIDTNTSMLIDSSTSESIDIGTSETIDTSTATPIDRTTSTSTNVTTSTSIDGTTSESIAHTIPSLIDRDSCFRTRPLEIPESLSCPQDITDSAQKSIDISSCDPTSDGDREITMEDLLELEEFLELEDGEKLEDLDSSRAVTMEDFLELEEWLEDMDQNSKKNLDDDQRTSRGYLETSPKVSIDRHQPDGIDRQPPHIIDQCPPYIIDRQSSDSINLHPDSIIDRCPPDCIDRHLLLDESHGFIVEMEPIEERMHESEASHNADSKHLRPLICAEEAVGLHKRVKRIHDPVKIVVPCDVVGLASSSSSQPIQDEVDKGPAKAASIDTDRIPSKDTNKPASIDTITSTSIDTGRVSEQKKFDVCGNLRGGETTTRSDKSRGKKRRNWKKRKRIMGKRKRSEEDEFAEGSTMAAQHRSTEHHKYRSPLNCVDRYSHLWQVKSCRQTEEIPTEFRRQRLVRRNFLGIM